MLWFFRKDADALRVETLFDPETQEFVAVLHYADGTQEARRFKDGARFRDYLQELERQLAAGNWQRDGGPMILPEGWPDQKRQD